MENGTLSGREATVYGKMVKCWEDKHHKAGLKFAKQILSNKRYSQHGETLSMRGLLLLGFGRREEAIQSVKIGLKNNIKSQVCWHAYGLVNRAEGKYEEAIKCLRNALKFSSDNMTIWRDLSVLQIHTGDLEGFRYSRHDIFQLKPSQRTSWCGLALSYHMLGEHQMAVELLGEFLRSQKDVNRDVVGQLMGTMFNKKNEYDYCYGEIVMYHQMLLREAGDFKSALEYLEMWGDLVCDKTKVLEIRGYLFLELDMKDEAVKVFWQLIDRNQENYKYLDGLAKAKGVTEAEDLEELYREVRTKFPRAKMPWLSLIKVVNDQQFENEIEKFLLEGVKKGSGGMMKEIRFIYSNKDKAEIVSNILRRFLTNNDNDKMWTLYHLAIHLDMIRDLTALEIVDQAMSINDQEVELFILRAKIYKHHQRMEEAVKDLKQACLLDREDRWVASKCAKYMLKIDLIEEAVEVMKMFTKPGEDPLSYLEETQAAWFLSSLAQSYRRSGERGEALKKCWQVRRYFEDVVEEQLDLHQYAMARLRMCAYVDMLRLKNKIHKFGFYEKVAHLAIDIYLEIFDSSGDTDNQTDKKKEENKAKRLRKKMEQEAREKSNKKQSLRKTTGEHDGPVKPALNAWELEKTEKPLDEALGFLRPLLNICKDKVKTQLAAFNIYQRKKKPLLMLQTIKSVQDVDCDIVSGMVDRLDQFMKKTNINPVVGKIIELNWPTG